MIPKRDHGFYWVKRKKKLSSFVDGQPNQDWAIGYWDETWPCWWLVGSDEVYYDRDFSDIGDRLIRLDNG